MAGPVTSMLRTLSRTSSSTILQLIDAANEDDVGTDENSVDETNLSNSSASKRSLGAGFLTSGDTKKGGGNTKKGVKAARDPDYLTPAAKKAFNHLWHAFTLAPILKHFDSKQHIWIEINMSAYAIDEVLSQLTLDDLG